MWVICPLILSTRSEYIWVDFVAIYSTLLQETVIGGVKMKKKTNVFFLDCCVF